MYELGKDSSFFEKYSFFLVTETAIRLLWLQGRHLIQGAMAQHFCFVRLYNLMWKWIEARGRKYLKVIIELHLGEGLC